LRLRTVEAHSGNVRRSTLFGLYPVQVLTLCGVSVTSENARHLVATLIADGSPDAIAAATLIAKGADRDLYVVGLTPAMRDATLSVLDHPPAGLEQLRGVLARDQRDRRGRST
jgi:hypothetical protein